MNLGQKFSGFLGRSLSIPIKLISESITFPKKAIGGFFGITGGCCGGGIEEDDKILNGSGIILGIPLSL